MHSLLNSYLITLSFVLPLHSISKKMVSISNKVSKDLSTIAEKVFAGHRISFQEGVTLFEKGSLSFLGTLANHVREKKNGQTTYYNRNFHIEPTNVCVFSCKFCSYSRSYKYREEGW